MAIREIVKLGHSALRAKSEMVKNIDKETQDLIKDLKDTFYNTDGVGLAAPQIGVNKRVIIIDLRDGMEPIILINPIIKRRLGYQESEEGCLSYPGHFGFLERPKTVIVKGLNEMGEEVKYKGTELLSIVFCHEIDHLEGIMFCDKAYDMYEEEAEVESEVEVKIRAEVNELERRKK
jgi:peptide deformylase